MEDPNYYLEGVVREKDDMQDFEGPLSLILLLLSKDKIEIRDIKIADILDQYLDYLDKMEEMDLEIASEFIQMASHLLYIKTRMLLKSDEEEVTELELLIQSLEKLKNKDMLSTIQKVIPQLKEASDKGVLYFAKLPEPLPKKGRVYEYRHEPVDLLSALYGIYTRGGKTPDISVLERSVPRRIVYSVRDKSREILMRLRDKGGSLGEMYRACATKSEMVATFMAVLELCSMGSIKIERDGDDYTVSFVGGDVDEIIEKIVE